MGMFLQRGLGQLQIHLYKGFKMPIRKFSDQSFESPNLEDWIGE